MTKRNKKALTALPEKVKAAQEKERLARVERIKKAKQKEIERRSPKKGLRYIKEMIEKIVSFYEIEKFNSERVHVGTFGGEERVYINFSCHSYMSIDVDGYLFFTENRDDRCSQLVVRALPLYFNIYKHFGLGLHVELGRFFSKEDVCDLLEKEFSYLVCERLNHQAHSKC
jgi:hypothetical protein